MAMENHKPKIREVLTSAVFIIVLGAFFILNIVVPAPTVLEAERRIPAKFPELSASTIFSGSFMSKFEDYAADRFVFRDGFRAMHSFMVFDLYMQGDMSGLYRSKNVGLGEFKRTNATAFRQSAQKVSNAAGIFDGLDMNIYYSLIPDKSIYAENYLPGFELDMVETILSDVLGDYSYIRIADMLNASDYYKTDLHWNQGKIAEVADGILSSMDAPLASGSYSSKEAGEFSGVYAGQLALPVAADVMSYADVPGLTVTYLSDKTLEFEAGLVYDFERFDGIDPYDMFLGGPQPLIVIENESAPERELYLFRDSFGSSLAPLLAASYSKVYVIDLRYINLMLLEMFIDFVPGSDILFIYSSQIFNNPSILQA